MDGLETQGNPRLWVRIPALAGSVQDWGETLEQGTEPLTAPWAPQCRLPTAPLGWVKCREHISLLIILCIIVYVTNKAHLSLICKFVCNVNMGTSAFIGLFRCFILFMFVMLLYWCLTLDKTIKPISRTLQVLFRHPEYPKAPLSQRRMMAWGWSYLNLQVSLVLTNRVEDCHGMNTC